MDSIFKLIISLIVLTIVLSVVEYLMSSFNHYIYVRSFSSDLKTLNNVMNSLKEIGGNGSWRMITINIPRGYSIYFNNKTNEVEIYGEEELNLTTDVNIIYGLNLSSGIYHLQVYYGILNFNNLKNDTLVFI